MDDNAILYYRATFTAICEVADMAADRECLCCGRLLPGKDEPGYYLCGMCVCRLQHGDVAKALRDMDQKAAQRG